MSELKTEAIIVEPVRHEFNGHPAKIHQHLAKVLVEDYSKKGEMVLDPFAGIGTIPRVAKALGRKGKGVEIEKKHVERAAELGIELIHGDSREKVLSFSNVDLILTSPPYGEAIGRAGDRNPEKTAQAKRRYEEKRFGKKISEHACYGTTKGNLGTLPFDRKKGECFMSELPSFVEAFFCALRPGGLLVWVVKDQRKGRKKLGAVDMFSVFRTASEKLGMIYQERRVAILPNKLITQWQRVNSKRWDVPISNTEHICVMRKGGGRDE